MTKKLKFRDEQVAEDVAKKAELGWLETEIMVYGCAYLDKKIDKVFYKISTSEADIYRFVENCRLAGYYPSKMLSLKRRYEMPTGMRESAACAAKIELAQILRDAFPKEFFYFLHQIADMSAGNEAAEYLWEEISYYENSLDYNWLYRLGLLIDYGLYCNALTLDTYKQLQIWLTNEQKYLGEEIVNKQRFQKMIYGFGYEKNGEMKYVVDAQKNTICRKYYALEEDGYVLSPIFSKQYTYHLCDELPKVILSFKSELKKNCDLAYMEKVRTLRKLKNNKRSGDINALIVKTQNYYGEDAANTLLSYTHRWCIYS